MLSKEEKIVEKTLADVGKKIDAVINKSQHLTQEAREEIEEKIQKFRQEKENLEAQLKHAKEKQNERWSYAKTHLSTALHEITVALGIIAGNKPK